MSHDHWTDGRDDEGPDATAETTPLSPPVEAASRVIIDAPEPADEAPDDAPAEAPEPALVPRRRILPRLKPETRFGIAAVLSFSILVAVLFINRGGASAAGKPGRATTLALPTGKPEPSPELAGAGSEPGPPASDAGLGDAAEPLARTEFPPESPVVAAMPAAEEVGVGAEPESSPPAPTPVLEGEPLAPLPGPPPVTEPGAPISVALGGPPPLPTDLEPTPGSDIMLVSEPATGPPPAPTASAPPRAVLAPEPSLPSLPPAIDLPEAPAPTPAPMPAPARPEPVAQEPAPAAEASPLPLPTTTPPAEAPPETPPPPVSVAPSIPVPAPTVAAPGPESLPAPAAVKPEAPALAPPPTPAFRPEPSQPTPAATIPELSTPPSTPEPAPSMPAVSIPEPPRMAADDKLIPVPNRNPRPIGLDGLAPQAAITPSALAAAEAAGTDDLPSAEHVVRRGENFWTISRTYYSSGRYWKALWAANRDVVAAPEKLYVGARIQVPPPDRLDARLIIPVARTSAPTTRGAAPVRASAREEPPMAAGSPASARPFGDTGEPIRPERGTVPLANVEDVPPIGEKPSPTSRSKSYTRPYTVRPNETVRSIARDVLGSSRRAEELLDLNRDVIEDETRLVPGTVLQLPEGGTPRRRP